MLAEGTVPVCLWVATMKDELRPVEKVKIGKTRIFEQPSLEYTYLMRKYFGAFANYIKANPGADTHSAIGVDKETEWARFYQMLRSRGKNGFDVDYSNYDGSVTSQAFDFFREVTDAYYGDKCPIRQGLLHILQNSWIVVGFYLTYTSQGNKSGNPLTDVFNSVTNVFVIYFSYLQGRALAGLSIDFRDFDRDVAVLTYGDDVIVTADNATLVYFNRLVVRDVARALGMTVTAADKGTEMVAVEPLTSLSFLKSKFVESEGCVLAPMPIDVARRELQWARKHCLTDPRILSDIKQNAVRFAAHGGRDCARELLRHLDELGENTPFDYDVFRLEVLEKQAPIYYEPY
jgi:hypothetical protein